MTLRHAMLALLCLAGCEADDRCKDGVCTAELRTATIKVVDSAGQPVEGLTTRTTFVPTGEVIPAFAGVPAGEGGLYVLVDDSSNAPLLADEDGELFRFEITSVTPPVSHDYLVTADPCHCHISYFQSFELTLDP